MKTKRRDVLKEIREEFNIRGVNYSERRKLSNYVKWYYIKLPLTKFNEIKKYMSANYPDVVVRRNQNPSWFSHAYQVKRNDKNTALSVTMNFPHANYN